MISRNEIKTASDIETLRWLALQLEHENKQLRDALKRLKGEVENTRRYHASAMLEERMGRDV